MRKPFQGVVNIVRFNWPFYVLAAAAAIVLIILAIYLSTPLNYFAAALLLIGSISTLASLLVSWYVYDLSDLYRMRWLDHMRVEAPRKILNINAGFDETSALLNERFRDAELTVYDFYDEAKHRAPSIKRARHAYRPFPGTRMISTVGIPFENESVDVVFAIMSAHEIRDAGEKEAFMAEVERVLSQTGQMIVVEHLRDLPNLAAYSIGAFHFQSRENWMRAFDAGRLRIETEIKITPFTTAFFLEKNGTAS